MPSFSLRGLQFCKQRTHSISFILLCKLLYKGLQIRISIHSLIKTYLRHYSEVQASSKLFPWACKTTQAFKWAIAESNLYNLEGQVSCDAARIGSFSVTNLQSVCGVGLLFSSFSCTCKFTTLSFPGDPMTQIVSSLQQSREKDFYLHISMS